MTNDLIVACTGVLFDCDGVLVDSTEAAERAWRGWAVEHGIDADQVLDGVHGRRSSETIALFVEPEGRAAAFARIEEIEIAGAAEIGPIPGAPELMKALMTDLEAEQSGGGSSAAGLAAAGSAADDPAADATVAAVVTSASRQLLTARLAAAGVPMPPVAITAADVTAGKPDPEGYLRAARMLKREPAACVVFEDSVTGVRAGIAAGVLAVIGVGERALATDAPIVVADLRAVRPCAQGLVLSEAGLLRRPGAGPAN